jgi:hypothetical protein
VRLAPVRGRAAEALARLRPTRRDFRSLP